MTEARREIKFTPAWNRTSAEPGKNYGVSSMKIWFRLFGPLAVVEFGLNTRWYLPADCERMKQLGRKWEVPETDPDRLRRMQSLAIFGPGKTTRTMVEMDYWMAKEAGQPEGQEVAWHSPVALSEDQTAANDCTLLAGGRCFSGGSGLRGLEWTAGFLSGGDEWVWGQLAAELAEVETRVKEQMEMAGRYS